MKNVKALRQFLLNGEVVVVGEVVSKSRFENAGEWQNLVNMKPAKLVETDEAVGKPKVGKSASVPGV